nr:hypothetical protein [Tanacetum cinerariifolium]
MQKAKKNTRKINFKKVVAQKFKEYNQKLEALTNINIYKSFKKAVQARVLTEIKKLLPTHILTAFTNYVRPRLNTSVLKVMKRNQISLFTKSSTSADDLSEIDLKIKLLNKIHLNKSNDTHTTHQQLYDTLYESITLDQEAFNAQDADSSFKKAKKLKALMQKDKLTIADLEGARLEKLKQQYKNDVELKNHVDQLKAAVLSKAKWNSDEDDVSKSKSFERHMRSDDKEYEFSYADLPRLSLNNVEDMYLLQVQDKLYHLLLEFVKHFNNSLLLFIRRVVIQNRVEDIQLEVESCSQTLNLTKPMMFFEGINQKIPFTMSKTYKGVLYLNQHNVKSFIKFSEVKKFMMVL